MKHKLSTAGLVYLCSPYTSHLADPKARLVEEKFRYDSMVQVCAKLIHDGGYVVFSPIVHCHPIKVSHPEIQGHWDYWVDYNHTLLNKADAVGLVTLHGWDLSKGSLAELQHAWKMGISDIFLIDEFHPNFDTHLSTREFHDLLGKFRVE